MGVSKEQGEAGWVVRMEGELGVAEAPALKQIVLEALEEAAAGRVVLEMGAVESLDICCLQVLLAASRSAGGRLGFGEASEACRETIELAGQEAAVAAAAP